MAGWEDGEVSGDGDELVDWLWDLADQYDVGVDPETGPVAASSEALTGASGVRKHLRRTGDNVADVPDEWATEAVDALPTAWRDAPARVAPEFMPLVAAGGGRRVTGRHLAAVAAVVLVVAGVTGLMYGALGGGSRKPSQITTGTTNFDQNVIATLPIAPAATTTTTSAVDTTTSDSTTTVTTVTTVALPGGTTTTTRRDNTTTTTRPGSSTTSRVTSTTTTTSTTVPSSTTSSSTSTSTTSTTSTPSTTTTTRAGTTTTTVPGA